MMPAEAYVLDAHALVWYLEDSPKLSLAARQAFDQIDQGNSLGVVPSIVLAEIMHMAERGRTPVNVEETIRYLQQAPNFAVVSLDLMVILLMVPLKTFDDLHDRVIVATARSFGASLVTHDETIRLSGAVPCVW